METQVLVKHTNNTSDDKAPNGKGWLEYWKETIGCQPPTKCSCCNEVPTGTNHMVGPHVEKYIEYAIPYRKYYIVPTCDDCNKKYKGCHSDKVFKVSDTYLCEVPSSSE